MPQVSIRELQRNAGGVLKDVADSGRPALVTSRGRPVAAVVPLHEEDLEDWVLANAAKFIASRREADEELAAGETTSLDAFLAKEPTGRRAKTNPRTSKTAAGGKVTTKRATSGKTAAKATSGKAGANAKKKPAQRSQAGAS